LKVISNQDLFGSNDQYAKAIMVNQFTARHHDLVKVRSKSGYGTEQLLGIWCCEMRLPGAQDGPRYTNAPRSSAPVQPRQNSKSVNRVSGVVLFKHQILCVGDS